jgi:hypothetical protein
MAEQMMAAGQADALNAMLKDVPIGRLGRPDEIASAGARAQNCVIVGCAPRFDEGLKTDALPGVADVVVTLHPAHAGVVSAEFGERRRAGNGIRHIIVAAVGMRDGVPANRACATLKPNDLS